MLLNHSARWLPCIPAWAKYYIHASTYTVKRLCTVYFSVTSVHAEIDAIWTENQTLIALVTWTLANHFRVIIMVIATSILRLEGVDLKALFCSAMTFHENSRKFPSQMLHEQCTESLVCTILLSLQAFSPFTHWTSNSTNYDTTFCPMWWWLGRSCLFLSWSIQFCPLWNILKYSAWWYLLSELSMTFLFIQLCLRIFRLT